MGSFMLFVAESGHDATVALGTAKAPAKRQGNPAQSGSKMGHNT